jgi:hypothetical protein
LELNEMRIGVLSGCNPSHLLVGKLAITIFGQAAPGADVSREEIASTLINNRTAIHSIVVRYQVSTQSVHDRPELTRTSIVARLKETTTGWMDGKIYFSSGTWTPSLRSVAQRLREVNRSVSEAKWWSEVRNQTPSLRLGALLDKATHEEKLTTRGVGTHL